MGGEEERMDSDSQWTNEPLLSSPPNNNGVRSYSCAIPPEGHMIKKCRRIYEKEIECRQTCTDSTVGMH